MGLSQEWSFLICCRMGMGSKRPHDTTNGAKSAKLNIPSSVPSLVHKTRNINDSNQPGAGVTSLGSFRLKTSSSQLLATSDAR